MSNSYTQHDMSKMPPNVHHANAVWTRDETPPGSPAPLWAPSPPDSPVSWKGGKPPYSAQQHQQQHPDFQQYQQHRLGPQQMQAPPPQQQQAGQQGQRAPSQQSVPMPEVEPSRRAYIEGERARTRISFWQSLVATFKLVVCIALVVVLIVGYVYGACLSPSTPS